jgi:RNA polymerase sigma-70 factor (ECF subfamily)
MRSGERRELEATALAVAIKDQIDRWRDRGEWWKICCAELLFVRGCPNKDVAAKLNITEQQVANQKFDFLARLRTMLERQKLSPDVFPELSETSA